MTAAEVLAVGFILKTFYFILSFCSFCYFFGLDILTDVHSVGYILREVILIIFVVGY